MLRVHSIETLGAHDGPGIRTVIFLQGCPMRCVYCHNPDMLKMSGGELMESSELCEIAVRYKSYYGESGGLTVSGGEPLMQAEGVIELLKIARANGIHSALDTSGAVFCPAALDLADLTILDIKHTDPEGYKSLTGFSIDNTLKTLAYLSQNKKRFIVRQVILTGITDNDEQIKKLATLAQAAEKIELLPFHNMGAHKYEKLGLEYTLKNMNPPDEKTMRRLNAIIDNEKRG